MAEFKRMVGTDVRKFQCSRCGAMVTSLREACDHVCKENRVASNQEAGRWSNEASIVPERRDGEDDHTTFDPDFAI